MRHSISGVKRVTILSYDGNHTLQVNGTTETVYMKHAPKTVDESFEACGYPGLSYSVPVKPDTIEELATPLVTMFQEYMERYEYHTQGEEAGPTFCAVSALEISIDRAIVKHFPKAIDDGVNWSRGKRGDAQEAIVTEMFAELCGRVFTEAEIRDLELGDANAEAVKELREDYRAIDSTSIHTVMLKHWCLAV